MIKRFINNIQQKPEHQKRKWALGMAVTFSVLIFASFAFYKGYLIFGNDRQVASQKKYEQMAVAAIPSPAESTKEIFGTAFKEIRKQYQDLKDSLSAVFVPFISGIEVYERK